MAWNQNQPYYAIVGIGKTGLSCVRHLVAKGIPVVIMDTRNQPPFLETLRSMYPQVSYQLGGLNANWLAHAEEIVVSPGFPLNASELRQHEKPGKPLIGDIELFARDAVGKTCIAITGSNGKSTVTTLVGDMVRAAGLDARVGGNLGRPALDLLEEQDSSSTVYVLELSSFQLELTHSLAPTVSVVLNISPDHLDCYPDFDAYLMAKQRIYKQAQAVVVNTDDPLSFKGCQLPEHLLSFGLSSTNRQSIHFGISNLTDQNKPIQLAQAHLRRNDEVLMPVSDLFGTTWVNVVNSLAALTLGSVVGLPLKPMLQVLRTFEGLPHRCQYLGEAQGIEWYNDSKATNVGAALATIESLSQPLLEDQKLIVIAGGNAKDGDFKPLFEPLSRYARALILLGRDAKQLGCVLTGACPVYYVSDMFEAVQKAVQTAISGDKVVLAPACSSLDGMFENFEHRGQVFMEAVKLLMVSPIE